MGLPGTTIHEHHHIQVNYRSKLMNQGRRTNIFIVDLGSNLKRELSELVSPFMIINNLPIKCENCETEE